MQVERGVCMSRCYRCEAAVPEGTETCPACGRSQFRSCYCGARLHKSERVCPGCGADWSIRSRQVRRKKRRHVKRRDLAVYVAGGAAVPLAIAWLLKVLYSSAAEAARQASGQSDLRGWSALAVYFDHYGGKLLAGLAHALALAAPAVLLAAIGGTVGAVVYLRRQGMLRRRRSRRVRRQA